MPAEPDTYHPVLNVSVMPWSTKNLAPSVWHQLYLQTVRERDAQPYSGGSSAALGTGSTSGSRSWLLALCLFCAWGLRN